MELSIITVNFRSWAHVDAALAGLSEAVEFTEDRWEMLVVDNASGDGQLAEFAGRYPGVRFIENAGNFGFANGNNLGAQHARGSTLLFMNPDVRADPGAVRTLLAEKAAHPEIGILSAPQLDAKGRMQKAFDRFPDLFSYFRTVRSALRLLAPRSNPDPRRTYRELTRCDWVSGSLLMIATRDFRALGGWSEDFWMYAEDMDLCKRASLAGLVCAVTPAARFTHLHGGASRQNPEVTCITKTEVMISAHVYAQRHFRGLHRLSNHALIAARNLVPLTLAALANLLTLGTIARLRISSRILAGLTAYYAGVARTGVWLSRRAPNFPAG